jgi:hypothetical protein
MKHNTNYMNIKFIAGVLTSFMMIGSCYAQVVENSIRTSAENGKIIITYDLKNNFPGTWINTIILGSHDSFAYPLTNVTGDVGKVAPGPNKRIEWTYGTQLDNFNGDLSFEIEAEFVPHLATSSKSLRKGKTNKITWFGGRAQDSIALKLKSRDNRVIWQDRYLNKLGKASIKLSPSLKIGDGYELHLTSKDDQLIIPVTMKRKVARFWIVLPTVAATVAVFYFSMPEPIESLPKAPEPPGSN